MSVDCINGDKFLGSIDGRLTEGLVFNVIDDCFEGVIGVLQWMVLVVATGARKDTADDSIDYHTVWAGE